MFEVYEKAEFIFFKYVSFKSKIILRFGLIKFMIRTRKQRIEGFKRLWIKERKTGITHDFYYA